MARAEESQVNQLLHDVRRAIEENRFSFVPREKNMRTLANLGLMPTDVMEEISHLTYSNYEKGPETDRDCPQSDDVWIFKTYIDRIPIYIKLKVRYQTDSSVVIISFHVSEYWK